jgi:hypothetical protein
LVNPESLSDSALGPLGAAEEVLLGDLIGVFGTDQIAHYTGCHFIKIIQ